MRFQISTFAAKHLVMLWSNYSPSAVPFKCDGCRSKSSHAGHLDKGSVHWEAWYVNVRGVYIEEEQVHYGKNFYLLLVRHRNWPLYKNKNHIFNMSLKLTNHKCLTAKYISRVKCNN